MKKDILPWDQKIDIRRGVKRNHIGEKRFICSSSPGIPGILCFQSHLRPPSETVLTVVFLWVLNSEKKRHSTFNGKIQSNSLQTKDYVTKFYIDLNAPQESFLLVLHLLDFDPKTSSLFSTPEFITICYSTTVNFYCFYFIYLQFLEIGYMMAKRILKVVWIM